VILRVYPICQVRQDDPRWQWAHFGAAAAGWVGLRTRGGDSPHDRPLVARARGLAGLLPCRRRQAGWHPLAAVGFARDWSPNVMDLRRGKARRFPQSRACWSSMPAAGPDADGTFLAVSGSAASIAGLDQLNDAALGYSTARAAMGHPARRQRLPAGSGRVRGTGLASWPDRLTRRPGARAWAWGQRREFTPPLAANQAPARSATPATNETAARIR
jgi:hypothetical protein